MEEFYSISDHLIESASKNNLNFYTLLKIPKSIMNEKIEDGFFKSIDYFSKCKLKYRDGSWIESDSEQYFFDINSIDELEDYLLYRINNVEKYNISQTILNIKDERYLLIQINHILADGISLLMFLNYQFHNVQQSIDIKYKNLPKKKNTPYKFFRPSQVMGKNNKLKDNRSFTYFKTNYYSNNKVIKAIFIALDKMEIERRSVWIPVNIRESFFDGFGNGISRIRIYDNDIPIKKQKLESFKNGELMGIPSFKLTYFKKIIVKIFLNRPLIDYSSLALSHIDEKLMSQNILGDFDEIISILNLHHRHSMGIFIHSNEYNHITITYDTNKLTNNEVLQFKEEFLNALDE